MRQPLAGRVTEQGTNLAVWAPVDRSDLTFTSRGVSCAAWLYRPSGDGPHPIVILGQAFGGIRRQRLDAFGERFATAGMAALVFDYRYFGDSEGEPRQLLDIKCQLDDYRAAIVYAHGLPGIDASRVALWGSSFSGAHVLTLAAQDHSLAACVAQVPHVDGIASMSLIRKSVLVRLTLAGIRDAVRGLLGRQPYTVATVGPPGSTAALTAPEAEPGYRSLVPPGVEWVDRVSARVVLTTPWYSPINKVKRIRCPVLICIGDADMTTPPTSAQKAADRIVDVEVKRYPFGHFDIYVGDGFEAGVTDQVNFLRRHLLEAPEHAHHGGPTPRVEDPA